MASDFACLGSGERQLSQEVVKCGATHSRFSPKEKEKTVTPAVPNTDVLYSSLASDPDLGEIVEMFVDEMPDRISTLIESFDQGDMETLRRTAHQIKGAVGGYGFNQITPYAAKLEASVRDNESETQIRESLDALTDLCKKMRAGTPD